MAADKQLLLAPEALRTKRARGVNSAELSPDNTETSLVDAGSACALGALGRLDMNLGKPQISILWFWQAPHHHH